MSCQIQQVDNEISELVERRDSQQSKKDTSVPLKECPICYDDIDGKTNCVTTECGHTFHCSCLMKNSAVNGFGCPMCRSVMAEEPEDEDDEDDYDSYYEDEEEDQFDDNALTSFRMFHQQLDDEEVEPEPEPNDEVIEVEEDDNVQETPATIATKLAARGVTMEDVVKVLLLEHGEYSRHDEQYERKASELYGEIRRILTTHSHSHR
jgi:hypothetical protein